MMRDFINMLLESETRSRSLIDVANFFLDVHDDLNDLFSQTEKEISDADVLRIIEREYVSGSCGAFALALHDKTGFPLVGINGGTHIAVRSPSGNIIDYLGEHSLQSVLARYGLSDAEITNLSREEVCDDICMSNEEEGDSWSEVNIAKFVIQTLGRW